MHFNLGKDIRQHMESWLLFSFMICSALFCLPFLPDMIATHWNGAWQANSWGAKWWILSVPVVAAAALPVLRLAFLGAANRYQFGVQAASNPESFLYHCWFVALLALCVLEMFMLASGFHTVVAEPHFLLFIIFGIIFLIAAKWVAGKRWALWALVSEVAGFLCMIVSLL